MSLQTFWPHSFDSMGKPKTRARDKDPASSSDLDAQQDGERPVSPGANLGSVDLDPAMAKAFEVMTANITKVIDDKLSPLSEVVRQHTEDLKSATTRLDEAEARILATEDSVLAYEARIGHLEKEVSVLSDKADMAENYSRRLNIRLLGLAEGLETTQPVVFFETWLPQLLKIHTDTGRIRLERAHRALGPIPPSGNRPRPLLLRFHAFQDKQRVMEAARRASQDHPIVFKESRLFFYNDFSSSVMKKRKAFDVVKRKLRDNGIFYGMFFPATLQVTYNGAKKRYTSPDEVDAFINSLTDS